jgi:hypothetical protein
LPVTVGALPPYQTALYRRYFFEEKLKMSNVIIRKAGYMEKIDSERLFLRKFKIDDVDNMLKNWIADSVVQNERS